MGIPAGFFVFFNKVVVKRLVEVPFPLFSKERGFCVAIAVKMQTFFKQDLLFRLFHCFSCFAVTPTASFARVRVNAVGD